jgi:hypothetical protein
MNEFRGGFSAMSDGFSTMSTEEVESVEGGRATASWLDPRTVGTIVQSFVNEATARYRALKA